jgi:hypothetical protein
LGAINCTLISKNKEKYKGKFFMKANEVLEQHLLSPTLVSQIKAQLECYSKKNNDPKICWENVLMVTVYKNCVTVAKGEQWDLVLKPRNPNKMRSFYGYDEMAWDFSYGEYLLTW